MNINLNFDDDEEKKRTQTHNQNQKPFVPLLIRSNILLSPVDFVDMFGSVCVFLRNALPLSNTINERKKWFLSAPRLCDHRVRRVVVPQPQRTSYIEKNR